MTEHSFILPHKVFVEWMKAWGHCLFQGCRKTRLLAFSLIRVELPSQKWHSEKNVRSKELSSGYWMGSCLLHHLFFFKKLYHHYILLQLFNQFLIEFEWMIKNIIFAAILITKYLKLLTIILTLLITDDGSAALRDLAVKAHVINMRQDQA